MEKKEWGMPKLIVLIRAKPEESILTFCKYAAWPESSEGPDATYPKCTTNLGRGGVCAYYCDESIAT